MVKWLKLGELPIRSAGLGNNGTDGVRRILIGSNRVHFAVQRIYAFWLKSGDFSVDLER